VSVSDDPRCGQGSPLRNDENIECVCNVVWNDWWKDIQEIPVEVGISVGCIHSIPHKDLNMQLPLSALGPWTQGNTNDSCCRPYYYDWWRFWFPLNNKIASVETLCFWYDPEPNCVIWVEIQIMSWETKILLEKDQKQSYVGWFCWYSGSCPLWIYSVRVCYKQRNVCQNLPLPRVWFEKETSGRINTKQLLSSA
jgi:hypothetical protein